MIPPEKRAAVSRALTETFGIGEADDMRDLTERPGSNRAFRIVVRGSAYLLRINTRAGDVNRHFECMQAAADAGLAPRVLYANAGERISITDFVQAVPFPASQALVLIPAALRRLHALPPFSAAPYNTTCTFLIHPGPMLDGLLQKFRTSSILSAQEKEELLGWYERLAGAYSTSEEDLVASHNDLFKPDNMLFDGERVWFVDWEAACRNDRYADLAVVANMIVTNDAEEETFLREYFGGKPDEVRRARFRSMQQLAHVFYAMAFLMTGSGEQGLNETVPGYWDYQRQFWGREVGLADDAARVVFGRVHWTKLARAQ